MRADEVMAARIELSLGSRWIFFGLAVLIVGVSTVAVWAARFGERAIASEFDAKARGLVLAVASSLGAPEQSEAGFSDLSLARHLNAGMRDAGVRYLYVRDETGRVLAHTFATAIPPAVLEQGRASLDVLATGRRVSLVEAFEVELPQERMRVIDAAARVSNGRGDIVHAGIDRSRLESRIMAFFWTLLVSQGVMAAVAVALLVGVVSGMRRRRESEETLQTTQQENKALLQRVLMAQDEERRRIARELHDEAGQWLTSLIAGLRTLEDSIDGTRSKAHVKELRHLSESTLDEVGRLARGLHPATLDTLGFPVAVDQYTNEYSQSHGIPVALVMRGFESDRRLPPRVEVSLYRIMQETLTNVVRHAEAGAVSVIIDWQSTCVRMIVADDGRGLGPKPMTEFPNVKKGMGLLGIRERVELIGGDLTVESAPGEGTTIVVEVPLDG